jgi:SAM-dependent methyltransferase
MNYWRREELQALRRLRERFIAGTAGRSDYWDSPDELALYDATFAERIGWKWDAVLAELTARAWRPRSTHVLDWGCGSGIASRRVLAHWDHFSSLALHDRSPLALRFATERARAVFPKLAVAANDTVPPGTLLVLSHVLNELPPAAVESLITLASTVDEIVWVEAGTHADSRRLIDIRERLLTQPNGFVPVAPCTHQQRCGMLAPENAPHWCHHFAQPPPAIFQDGRWVELGRELGIDLRALPYSFLVLERPQRVPPTPPGLSRVIGRPREFKGYDKVLSCQASGVCDLMLQKRDAPALLRELRDPPPAPVYRWTLERGKIVAGEPLAEKPRDEQPGISSL